MSVCYCIPLLPSRLSSRAFGVFHLDGPTTGKSLRVESAFFQSYIKRVELQCEQDNEPVIVASPDWLPLFKEKVALLSRDLDANVSVSLKHITEGIRNTSDVELVFPVTVLAGALNRSFFVLSLSKANGESVREFARTLSIRFGAVHRWNNQQDMLKAVELAVEINSLTSEFSLAVAAATVFRLEVPYLLRLLYFFMKRRQIPEHMMGPLETAVTNHLDKLSLDDLSLIAISFFKCKRPIRSLDIVKCMAERLCSQLSVSYVSDVSVAAILKQLRYVERGEFWTYLRTIVQIFSQCSLDKFMLVNWVHLAYWCTKLCFFDEQFAAAVHGKCLNSYDQLRAKDAAIMFHYFALFNYPEVGTETSDTVDTLLVDKFRSKAILSSCNRFPEALSTALRCAAMRNKYPMDLIEFAFSRQFLDLYLQRHRHYFPLSDIFFVDCSLAIDRPDFNGQRLNMADFFAVMEAHSNIGNLPSLEARRRSKYFRLCSSLIPTLCAEFNCRQDDIHFDAVLPHFIAPDLMLSFSAGKLRKGNVQLAFKSYSFKELEVPATETRVVVLLCQNNRCRLFTTTWLGHVEARKRQLLRLGYNIVELNGYEFDKVPMDCSTRRSLIKVLKKFNEERARGVAVRLF
uniref:RAP domain-containing protein n=1 Tax=Trichuris muris TaxID=70415 RepID=A0A5S6Q3Q4_TRIMR